MALTDKLTSIAAAIREKGGTTGLLTLDAMPTAIANLPTGGGGGEDLVPNPLVYSGDCSNLYYKDHHNWILQNYLDRMIFKDITDANNMFYDNKALKKYPAVAQKLNTKCDWSSAFASTFMTEMGDITNWYPAATSSMFSTNRTLRYLPNFINPIENIDKSYKTGSMFQYCHSLRIVPSNILGMIGTEGSYSYYPYSSMFKDCFALNEIVGLRVSGQTQVDTCNYNTFTYFVNRCYHLKRLVFTTKEDGTPFTVKWKNQTIDLSQYVGWAGDANADKNITTSYNSGITADKEVVSQADYERLKDDPDWWSRSFVFSRFGHNAAVELINSLPDTSAYLATQSNASNNIKFYSNAGNAIDGGSVSALTEEEIAVAAAKGWSIAYTTG